MNKGRICIVTGLLIIAVTGITAAFTILGKSDAVKENERNYGLAHFEYTIGKNGAQYEDTVDSVPIEDTLIKNLKKENYSIFYYDTALDTGIPCRRIYAEKGTHFIDICYGLEETDAETVFNEYDSTYKEYYLMAMNGPFVYCISDKKMFQTAGYKSLANSGIQFINYEYE